MRIKINIYALSIFTIIIFYAFVDGFRIPSAWSINYYLPSFFDGFYRRALPGTILSILGDLRFNYYTIAIIQLFTLLSLLLCIYYFFQKNILMLIIISLYLVSPAGAYLFHNVGYIDQLIYLVLFISIATFKKHKIFSIGLFSSSMFIHEMALFVTLPIYFTYIYISTDNLKKSFMYVLPSLVFFFLIYMFFQTVPVDKINALKEEISKLGNYRVRNDFYTTFEYIFTGTRNRINYNFNHLNQIFLISTVASLTSLIIYKLNNKQTILPLLVFLTGLAPLALGFFGWDIYRWFFLSISSLTVVFVVVLLNYRITFSDIVSLQSISILYFIFYILLISNLYLGYFDGYKHRPMTVNSIMEIKSELLFEIPTE